MPRPSQQPHPPVWVAAIASPESFVWAGRRGYHVMIVPFAGGLGRVRDMVRGYREAWREAGHPPGTEQIQTSLHCYLAETHREAVEGARPRVERYIEVFGEAVRSWAGRQSAQYAGYDKMLESIARTTIESMLANKQALIGTPDEVVEQLQFQIEAFGEIEPSMQINFGGMSDEEAFRTLELFATRVMPKFPPR